MSLISPSSFEFDSSDRSEAAAQPRRPGGIGAELAQIEAVLARIERLAHELRAEPDDQLRCAATELRAVFGARSAMEPAVARMRDSVTFLRRHNQEGARRELERRAQGLDHLEQVFEAELLPHLRRLGFEL